MVSSASNEPKIHKLLSPQENISYELSHNNPSWSIESKTPRRVKVYLLQGDDWLDNGTGYCMGEVESGSLRPYFIVRNELDSDDIILRSYLEGSIQFQRQQETLIVWTDLSGKDLALSFQENEGCADLCDFIVRAQQENLSPSISLYYVLTSVQSPNGEGPREITELITGPITYPSINPTPDDLDDILDIINQGSNSLYTRYKIRLFIIETNYLDKLIELFENLEKQQALESLHCLSDILKLLLAYNEPPILEEFVSSERRVIGLVGILEYDRDFPDHKACHREYLQDPANYKLVITIAPPPCSGDQDLDIFRKDFVLNYLRASVLVHFDDQVLGSVSTMIYNNQIEILNFLKDSQANKNFLDRLFKVYDVNDSLETKRDGVRMLHQYTVLAKGHSATLASDFFIFLMKAGLLKMIKFALRDAYDGIRVMGTEILTTVIDQDVTLVNVPQNEHQEVDELEKIEGHKVYSMSQQESFESGEKPVRVKFNLMNDMSLTLVLSQLLLDDSDPGLKTQAYEAIKTLLCSAIFDYSETSEESSNVGVHEHDQDSLISENQQRVRNYFHAFYEQVAPKLFGTFVDLTREESEARKNAEIKLSRDPTLFQHLCDLICFCCQEHEPSICRPFFIEHSVINGILKVLSLEANVTLKLGVMRCFKSLILLDDYEFCCHIIENKLFDHFFEFFHTVVSENSLPNSSCLDLLEILIKRSTCENIGLLTVHVSKNYRNFLESKIDYVSTGKDLLQAALSCVELIKDGTATSVDIEQDMNNDHNSDHYSPLPTRKEELNESNNGSSSGQTKNLFENFEKEQVIRKRKREDGNNEVGEKQDCKSAYQDSGGIDDDAKSRGMTIAP